MLTSVTTIGAKIFSALISLLSVPLTLPYLGPERFGLWITLLSFQTVFGLADFGVGNGVLQVVSDAFGRRDYAKIRRTILAGLRFQVTLGLAITILFVVTFPIIPWGTIFHVRGSDAKAEIRPAIACFFSIFVIRSVTQVIQQAQFAVQSGYIASIWNAVGNIAALVGLVICAAERAGVPALCLVVSGLPVVASVLNVCLWLYRSQHIRRRVSFIDNFEKSRYRELLTVGSMFFVLQLFAQLHAGIDPLIVNQILGPTFVSHFIIVQRPVDLLLMFLMLALQPVWPAYREAKASGDIEWIRRTFRRTMIASLAVALCFSISLLFLGTPAIEWWTHFKEIPSAQLLKSYCVSILFSSTQAPIALLLNGLGSVRVQLMIAAPAIMASIFLKTVLLSRIGLVAVPLTTFAVGVFLMIPVQALYIRYLFRTI